MEKINNQKEIMVYMGSYVRDRSEGKYNDYVTYDGDTNTTYNSYINLKTDKVYNIDKNQCKEFERKHIVIKVPVSANSFDSYLSNYLKIKECFLKLLTTNTMEDSIREIRRKYEKKIGIDDLRKTRKNIKKLETELSRINEEINKIVGKMENISSSCNHEVVVKTESEDLDDHFNKATCLICNKKYSSLVSWSFDQLFSNIIHFESEDYSKLTEEEKIEIAFRMFEEEKEKSQNLSDLDIVEHINNQLKYNKESICSKVLSNKPNTQN